MMTNNVKMILGIGLLGTAAYLIYDGMKKKSKSSFTGPVGKRYKNQAGIAGFETTLEEAEIGGDEAKKISQCYSDGEESSTPGFKRCCKYPYISKKILGKCDEKPKLNWRTSSDYGGGYDGGGYDSYNGPKVELGAETLNCPRGTFPYRGKDGNIYCLPNSGGVGGYSSGYGAYSPTGY